MGMYEHPEYQVILMESPYELREYETFTVVEYSNDSDSSADEAFRTLFRYISNENKAHRKINMTVPVIEEIENGNMRMAFVVPKDLQRQTPEPVSPLLNVKTIQGGVFAVINYGGRSNAGTEQQMKENLTGWIQEKGYQSISNFMLAFYNAPFTPAIFRHNEILVKVSRV